ncbi:retinaldehyde-binding protein 1 [Ostrinia nubilalis]|uniref:retinaldehyde-binding protein 1 n=1 Tax=Ostrinia nubilalis TaxID=29057 RepID=UPI0030822D67
MTTASVLLTVTTTWNLNSEKIDKGKVGRSPQSIAAETAKELRETPATREQGLKIMREWIQQNCDIKNVRQDDSFLLRFLRHKKYSIPMAQQTLLKYLNLRKYYPEIFMNLDCEDSKLQDIINNGYVVVSPVRDSKGRRVIVYNMSRFNASQLTCWDMCRVHTMIYESLLEDPLDQICGFTHVGDGSGVSGAHVTAWNPTDFARLMKWGEQSMPMRHKEFHLINIPAAIKYIIDFAKSKVSPKMVDRLYTHSTLKQLHKNIDVACLPTVYGGEIPLQEMISFTKQILSDQRKKVCHLTEMEILSTRGITSSKVKNKPDQISVEGSFRKLEID